MRAWVARRREGGALLGEGLVFGTTPAPFELLVQEVTDQGKRRPMKVARLYEPGTKRSIAELVGARLVWFKGDEFVLAGADVSPGERGPVHAAQSWLCKLAPPEHALGYSMRFMFDKGRQLSWQEINGRWASVTNAYLGVRSVLDEQLARHTTRALLQGRRRIPAHRLRARFHRGRAVPALGVSAARGDRRASGAPAAPGLADGYRYSDPRTEGVYLLARAET